MTFAAIVDIFGGVGALTGHTGSSSDLIALTRQGFPARILPALASELAVDRRVVAHAVGITERTLNRRLSAGSRLSSVESDRTVRFARVLALDGQKPSDLLDTDPGVQQVSTVLGRIAYGVYS